MDTIKDLIDLLMYQVNNLYSAEEMIEQAMPAFIAKAKHSSVKNALKHHAERTPDQKQRLTRIPGLLKEKMHGDSFFEGTLDGGKLKSKGMEGLLAEVNDLLEMKLAEEVTDAAIIACVQKIEHYEICSYGTALAFAKQLHLHPLEQLLNETLQEEYDADDLLTALATAAINKEAAPEGLETSDLLVQDSTVGPGEEDTDVEHTEVIINERTINSPGGRAGTSHRRYGTGESRGH
jgi:ferritin-like metal-binding protein YciE